jgi:c-di-GMP-related signal transduction protein
MVESQGRSWNKFVARQPIMDSRKNIIAYELLFRSGLENYFQSQMPDQASSSVLVSSFLLMGIQSLTGGRKAFINFTENLLAGGYATFLPPEHSVIEIIENVNPDKAVIEACIYLKQKGYMLALDDYPCDGRMAPLLPFADFVKVDWLNTPAQTCRQLAEELIPKGIKLLAEKVETHEQYHQALGMGYRFFQGFFFCEPEILTGRDIPLLQANCLLLLREVNREEPDLAAIERILLREPSLCYKLLRYLNSALFYFRGTITSIRHALSLLGEQEVRKWISIVTLASMGEEKPDALVVTSVIRAKFCESIGRATGQVRYCTDLFLTGLFSLIDAILDKPMQTLLGELPISDEISFALLGKESRYLPVFNLVCAYEKSDWDQVSRLAGILNLNESRITQCYIDAITWSHEIGSADTSDSELETPNRVLSKAN